jgi:hypothetical protein
MVPAAGTPLHDRRAFCEHAAVVELQRRHIALGVDAREVGITGRELGPQVDLLERERQTRFAQDDVWRQGAGARAVVELHRSLQ